MSQFQFAQGPHIRHEDTTRSIMLDVCIALSPAFLWGIYVFGFRAVTIALLSILFSVGSEACFQLLLKRPLTISDLSSVATGLILALSLPVSVPLWIVPIGAIFATIAVKCLFGGLGKNPLNPALAARALLFLAFSKFITRFTEPFSKLSVFALHPTTNSISDSISQNIPAGLPMGEEARKALSFSALFSGTTAGPIGQVSAILLLAGLLYLLVRKVVSWHIPAGFLGTVFFLGLLFPQGPGNLASAFLSVLCGGVIFSAVFCATDPTTSPIAPWSKLTFGFLCGLFTFVLRLFGLGYEAPVFAILIANLLVYPLDLILIPRAFGTKKIVAK